MDMQVKVGRRLVVEHPTEKVLRWAAKELTLPNPDYAKKARMGFWVGNTPKTLSLYEIHGDKLILPFGLMDEATGVLSGAEFHPDFPTFPHIDFGGQPMELYDYQTDALLRMFAARYGILVSPAGSGKTQIAIALAKAYSRPTLWLTHTADLLAQSKSRAERYMDPALIGTITRGKVNIGRGITFATVQTMAKLDLWQYRDMWDVVIVDECHHCAGTPTAMTQFATVVSNLAARHKYGLTATAHRADGLMKAVYALLGGVKYEVPDSAVKDRIVQVTLRPVFTGVGPMPACMNPDGTLNYTRMIKALSEDAARNEIITKRLVEDADRSCLILSERLEHLKILRGMLPQQMQEESALIHGQMTTKRGREDREQAVQAMRDGRLKYLFATYQLAKEGLDIPRLERLYMTTPVKDKAVVIQAVGRIARAFHGKSEPVAVDFIDAIRYCENAYRQRRRIYKNLNMKIDV